MTSLIFVDIEVTKGSPARCKSALGRAAHCRPKSSRQQIFQSRRFIYLMCFCLDYLIERSNVVIIKNFFYVTFRFLVCYSADTDAMSK